MASIKQMETKDGRRFFKISVSRGYGKTPYTMRWYWPDGWSKRSAERELKKVAAEFELKCSQGEVLNRSQAKEKAVQEAAEAAKLKTVRQYADGVYMAAKSATFSENARSSYRMFFDRHILPVLGDTLLTDVTPAMVTKLLIDFQKAGYAHASTIKLYNILNGVFEMAFLDDSIPMNPMLKVKRPAARKDETPKEESEKALTAKELAYVFSCVENEPLKWQAYINLAADSGGRRGELCGLWWSDIDWKSGTITIRRNLQYTVQKGVYVAAPKNGKVRVVDVGPETLALLRQLREEQSASCISKWDSPRMERRSLCSRNPRQSIFGNSGRSTASKIFTRTNSGTRRPALPSPVARTWYLSVNAWAIATRRLHSECTPTPMKNLYGGPVRQSGTR